MRKQRVIYSTYLRLAVGLMSLMLLLLSTHQPRPATSAPLLQGSELTIYTDGLSSGWADWSWNTTVNFNQTSPVHSGSAALAATFNQAWAGLYFHYNTNINTSAYDTLRFWIHGGSSGGHQIQVKLADVSNNFSGSAVSVTSQANTWTQVSIPLSNLGGLTTISGVAWQEASGGSQPTFYLDDIALVNSGAPPPPGSGPTLTVNAGTVQHAISPYIYGMNFASPELAADLRLPVNRWGGNSTTRYNWQLDVHNTGSDWYFENIPDENNNPAALPNGSASDDFVEANQASGTETLLTIPLIGWTPKRRLENHPYDCGFKVSLYNTQQSVDDPWDTDCGNGVHTNGTPITGNNPLDTSQVITETFVQDWLTHLMGRYGAANTGGVKFYNLDNEPMLWNSTHRDVHPQPTNYDEMRNRTYQYAAAIKATDNTAQTLGPVLWGWTAYFYSALDQAGGGAWWLNPPDRNAHGGIPFVEWYLQQMRSYEQTNGVRILDYLDLHYYPQADVALQGAGDAVKQARRLRSTRSLWDPTYVDESWIAEPVYLIPRMRAWVNTHYPGTKLAISEYNWGALDHINGALAQADVLGIFGRERLDLATLWAPPQSGWPADADGD